MRTRSFRSRLANRIRDERDRGSSILEFTGFLPILIIIGLACIQLGLIGYGINQAGTGARAAARATSLGGDGVAVGAASVSDWLNPEVDAPLGAGDTTTATVIVHVPAIIPIFDEWDVRRSATMPNDEDN
ncbi:TadE/TadG family type IV pilus assembly protein [Streptomyces sp. NBC_00576]|uniref:TadE/TadG family type IV pilus assembly protein n=1 Tax=Streptomyces sp. NBC_00576 TaxID=2903665 RepID=UPI002E8120A4|nr:TadE/TadG family type IV pilus assembly protein [Streptomyces sp. NBC_00576]WUB71385.1 pilus assembly protein [Streptomyces sp. NBC_00576]